VVLVSVLWFYIFISGALPHKCNIRLPLRSPKFWPNAKANFEGEMKVSATMKAVIALQLPKLSWPKSQTHHSGLALNGPPKSCIFSRVCCPQHALSAFFHELLVLCESFLYFRNFPVFLLVRHRDKCKSKVLTGFRHGQ